MKIESLLALRGQPPDVGLQSAESLAREIYGLDARATSLDGERDRNFRLDAADGRQYVLKFIDPEADDVIVAGQSAALAHIANRDPQLPAPRVIRTRTGGELGSARLTGSGDCRVRLISYLPGKLIQNNRPAPASLLRAVGRRIAQLDRALAGFSHPALAQPIAWDIRQAPVLSPVLSEVQSTSTRGLLSEALEPVGPLIARLRGLRAQAIHGDCHGRNILINDSEDDCAGIIDLGDMIHAPLALELAVALAEFLTDGVATLDTLAELIRGYTAVQPLRRDEIDCLYELIRARIAVGVLIQTWRERSGEGRTPASAALEAASADALSALAGRGAGRLTREMMDAAGVAADLLRRRHNTLGANAELSYNRPLHLVRGAGVWVFTSDGERLLDVYNNVPHVGHAHPAVVEAIAQQSGRIASNTRYLDERIIEYVERLTATLPPDLDACLFVNSGSEANDVAWRMAKSLTGHGGALVMKHAYHGITDAISALSPAICAKVPPHVEELAAPSASSAAPSVEEAASAASADVLDAIGRLAKRGFSLAALMIDSAITSTGIFDPAQQWSAPIAAAVHAAGGLIIADEVQFGLGRSGSHFWGFAHRGYHPDIVTLGKPVGNGYPLGLVITRREILERFQRDSGFFSTFGGNPVAAAAGMAVLEVLEREQLVDNARTTGDYFIRRLRGLAATNECLREIRGRGLMIGVEVTDRILTQRIVNGLRDRGVLIGSEGPLGNVLKLRPPMPFRPEHAEIVIEALTSTLSDVHP